MRLHLCCCVSGLCSCSLAYNSIDAVGAAAIGAGLVHLPQLQTLEYVMCPAVCAGSWCTLAREHMAIALPLCVWFVSGSLQWNRIGDAGAAAVGAVLVDVPQLQTLRYVVCPTVCAGSWCTLARERGAMACACAAVVCVVCVRAALRST
jgi:hypothetical protein